MMLCALGLMGADRQPPISVCELIAHRMGYTGRMVAVRGAEGVGGHGVYLMADRDCAYRLVTRGVEWPNVIWLTYPDNKSPDQTTHAHFKVDLKSVNRANDAVLRAGYRWEDDIEVVTYVGLFVTYGDDELGIRANAGIPGGLRLGFGPVGLGAPAQILIKGARKDVVLHGAAKTFWGQAEK